MAVLPVRYRWLLQEPGPKLLQVALADYGVTEKQGAGSNPIILQWAQELGIASYTSDGTPWCGLAMAHWVQRAGFEPVAGPLRARNWASFGTRSPQAMLGDVLVFERGGAGHVGIYLAENGEDFLHVAGNVGDCVAISPIEKSRLIAVRRCPWRVAQPANVRPIRLASLDGARSTNEA